MHSYLKIFKINKQQTNCELTESTLYSLSVVKYCYQSIEITAEMLLEKYNSDIQ